MQDILITFVDGLKGFPDAIAVEYPQIRTKQSPTENEALSELERSLLGKFFSLMRENLVYLGLTFLTDDAAVENRLVSARDGAKTSGSMHIAML